MASVYKESRILLFANNPVIIFVANNMLEPNTLPDDFKETGEVMSILKVSKFALPENNKIKASQSKPFKIYQKSFPKGSVTINFKTLEDKPSLNSLIMFYMLNPTVANPLSCGGVEMEVSKTDGEGFESCKASS